MTHTYIFLFVGVVVAVGADGDETFEQVGKGLHNDDEIHDDESTNTHPFGHVLFLYKHKHEHEPPPKERTNRPSFFFFRYRSGAPW